MADLDVDEWVHLVEETALVVFEVGGLEVEVNVTMAGCWKDNYDWHKIFFNNKQEALLAANFKSQFLLLISTSNFWGFGVLGL